MKGAGDCVAEGGGSAELLNAVRLIGRVVSGAKNAKQNNSVDDLISVNWEDAIEDIVKSFRVPSDHNVA